MNVKPRYRHLASNTADLLAALAPHRLEIAPGDHLHVRGSISYESASGLLRFHQAGAVVGPNGSPLGPMPSGVTMYQVRGGRVDNGTFLPLNVSAVEVAFRFDMAHRVRILGLLTLFGFEPLAFGRTSGPFPADF